MAEAKLGITVTSTGVAAAIADLDKLAPAAAKAEQATTQLSQSITKNLGQAANQADSFAARINKALDIRSNVGKGAADSAAAMGTPL
jgi:hypothetical protein